MIYSGVYVFGDSLVDAGNALKLAEWYGDLTFSDLPDGAPSRCAGGDDRRRGEGQWRRRPRSRGTLSDGGNPIDALLDALAGHAPAAVAAAIGGADAGQMAAFVPAHPVFTLEMLAMIIDAPPQS
jgi:hypothetical protein